MEKQNKEEFKKIYFFIDRSFNGAFQSQWKQIMLMEPAF